MSKWMNELKDFIELNEFVELYRKNPRMLPATLIGVFVGGMLGVIGFYGGWLG